jgi:hypothetical protein
MTSLGQRFSGASNKQKSDDPKITERNTSPQIEQHLQRRKANHYPRNLIIIVVIAMMMSATTLLFSFGNSLICDSLSAAVPITVTGASDDDKEGTVTALDRRMLKYIRSYSYVPPARKSSFDMFPSKECGAAPTFDGFFALRANRRSANNEDKWIYENLFLGGNNNSTGHAPGTYVEIGAFNGMEESNSRFFEACLGWEGLLVEGQPGNYLGVLQNRPFAHKMSFAPSCSAEYERVNKTVQFANYPMANSGLKGHAKTYDAKPHVDVPCGPFTPVLEDIFAFANKRINFFSLDVEGSENLVLKTIDFSKVMIDVMMIEIQNNHCKEECEVREQVRQKMASEGFQRYEGLIPKSDIYVHPKSPYQLPTKYKAVSVRELS